MRGIVVTGLEDYICSKYGLSQWHTAIDVCLDKDQQVITAAEYYDDETVLKIITVLTEQLEVPVTDFITDFGKHLFKTLKNYYSFLLEDIDSFNTLLMSLDQVIHANVKKVHPDAQVPKFTIESHTKGWTVKYESERKLCYLAIGLLHGAADFYDLKINLEHQKCMHNDSDHCLFEINLLQ
jgi:predicted hydrocarbon binding protein